MRIKSLDALRGLAALLVVIHHLYLVALGDGVAAAWPAATPLNIVVLGRPNVILFFVLSGYVLTLPFLGHEPQGYGRYLLKRFCRLYLPFVAAILASAVLYAVIAPGPIPALGDWFNTDSWNTPLGWEMLARHLLMTGLPGDGGLDNVMWSLVYELRISLIFPLLVLFVRTGPLRALMLTLLGFGLLDYAIAHFGIRPPFYGPTPALSLLVTAYFTTFFVFGIVLAMEAESIGMALAKMKPWALGVLWMVAIIALSPRADLANGIGASLLIILSAKSGVGADLLNRPSLQWLGRVSYSLYLTHLLVILAAVHLLYGLIPLWAILVGSVPVSLIVAETAYRLVEAPAMTLGRRLSRRNRFGVARA